MKKLYRVEQLITLNPNNPLHLQTFERTQSEKYQDLLNYLNDRKHDNYDFNDAEEYRFYFLSNEHVIALAHEPRPPVNNSYHCYYTLSELLSGKKEVQIDS